MGVAYDTYITQSDFNKLDSTRKHIALLKAIMLPDVLAGELHTMQKITGGDISASAYGVDALALDTDKLKANSFSVKSFTNNSINGEITVTAKKLLFFSIPYDEGWSATVNGKAIEMIMADGGLSAVLVEPGNNAISLRYDTPYVKTGLCFTLFGLLIFAVLLFRHRRCTNRNEQSDLCCQSKSPTG
jgi:hypothetical protein